MTKAFKKTWKLIQAQTTQHLNSLPTAEQIWLEEENLTKNEIEAYESQFEQKENLFKTPNQKKLFRKKPIRLSFNDLKKMKLTDEKRAILFNEKLFFSQKDLQRFQKKDKTGQLIQVNWNHLSDNILKRFDSPEKNNYNLVFFYKPTKKSPKYAENKNVEIKDELLREDYSSTLQYEPLNFQWENIATPITLGELAVENTKQQIPEEKSDKDYNPWNLITEQQWDRVKTKVIELLPKKKKTNLIVAKRLNGWVTILVHKSIAASILLLLVNLI